MTEIIKEKFATTIPGYKNMEQVAKSVVDSNKNKLSLILNHLSLEAKKASAKDLALGRIKIGPLLENVGFNFWVAGQIFLKIEPLDNFGCEEKLAKDIFNLSYKSVIAFIVFLEKELDKLFLKHRNDDNAQEADCVYITKALIHLALIDMEKIWSVCKKYTE
ncbi:MAG: hypothetical protein Q7J14_00390 [Candidatus Magasanikbacteria bacterium]|nr:hypothetical protein [Candidatus Magasanikbacteria bacterium]